MLTNEQITLLAPKYIDTVYRVALNCRKSPSDAEDITSNVFLSLWRFQPELESDDHAKFWLLRVTVNECKNSSAVQRHLGCFESRYPQAGKQQGLSPQENTELEEGNSKLCAFLYIENQSLCT